MAELSDAPPLDRFVLRGEACREFGLGLPVAPCRASGDWALWLGPDEWLLLAPRTEGEGLRARVEAMAGGRAYALVDVSHRQVGFVLGGAEAEAEALLNGAVPLDLSEDSFPPGMCVRTVFEKAEIVLWRLDAATWRVEVERSFAAYVREMLWAIARAEGVGLVGTPRLGPLSQEVATASPACRT